MRISGWCQATAVSRRDASPRSRARNPILPGAMTAAALPFPPSAAMTRKTRSTSSTWTGPARHSGPRGFPRVPQRRSSRRMDRTSSSPAACMPPPSTMPTANASTRRKRTASSRRAPTLRIRFVIGTNGLMASRPISSCRRSARRMRGTCSPALPWSSCPALPWPRARRAGLPMARRSSSRRAAIAIAPLIPSSTMICGWFRSAVASRVG